MNGKVLERYAELMIDKIRQMSAGEWQKPWFTPRTGLPQNISGRPYNSMNRPEPCKTENAVLYPETALRLRCAHSGHQRKNFLISSKRIMITKR